MTDDKGHFENRNYISNANIDKIFNSWALTQHKFNIFQ